MREYYFDIDGKKVPNEESMLARLLDDDVLFCNSRKYLCADDKTVRDETIVLFILANDVFVWGCADAEDITTEELPQLFDLHVANPKCGSIQWCCIKRNEKPQEPIVEYLKENGGWNETLESLPENRYDTYLREKHEKEKAAITNKVES